MVQVTKWLDATSANMEWLESEKKRIGKRARIRFKSKSANAPIALFINKSLLSNKEKK